MPPASHRKSPTPQTSSNESSSSIFLLASQSDIPTSSELNSLLLGLQEQRKVYARRKKNIYHDQENVLQGSVGPSDISKSPLRKLLDLHYPPDASSDIQSQSNISSGKSKQSTASSAKQYGKGKSSTQPSSSPPFASPQPRDISPIESLTPGGTNKIRVKRETERDREPSITSVVGSAGQKASSVREESEKESTLFEGDWDDEGPARPGRAYLNKRKRNRATSDADQDSAEEASQSDLGSPATSRAVMQDSTRKREKSSNLPGQSATQSGIKLRLNPTVHTRRDSFAIAGMRKSGLRGEDVPMSPYQLQQAALWELPKRTPETFIPSKPPSRQLRDYPIKPEEVDVDFSAMDWRERDRERDRIDAASGSSAGPGPGQAVIKDSTAMSRARDRKQDQVPHHIFQQWCDGWFRTLTEEDLAWLSSKSGDLEPFQTPSLGRHYTEVWEEEEETGSQTHTVYMPGVNSALPAFSTRTHGPLNGTNKANLVPNELQAAKFDPRQLRDENLLSNADEAHGGPLTERLLASILPTPPASDADGPNSATPQPNGHSSGGYAMNGHSPKHTSSSQDLSSFEDRLAKELRAINVLGKSELVDWSERTDDEISSTLRSVQKLLRQQMRINDQRKAILFKIAMERMAYQEYIGCLASVDREIESGWLKRQTQIKKSMQAQKKKKGSSTNPGNGAAQNSAVAAVAASATGAVPGSPAGGTPGSTSMMAQSSGQGVASSNSAPGPIKPQFSDSLLAAMERRRQLRYALEPLFAAKPLAKWTPNESIFANLDCNDDNES